MSVLRRAQPPNGEGILIPLCTAKVSKPKRMDPPSSPLSKMVMHLLVLGNNVHRCTSLNPLFSPHLAGDEITNLAEEKGR
jgi:hypothetical protein